MYQGTRPIEIFCIDEDLTGTTVYLDIKTPTGAMISKTGDDLDIVVEDGVTSIAVMFTQEETLALPEGVCQVQARWIDQYGNASLSDPANIEVHGILNKRVITYKEGDT